MARIATPYHSLMPDLDDPNPPQTDASHAAEACGIDLSLTDYLLSLHSSTSSATTRCLNSSARPAPPPGSTLSSTLNLLKRLTDHGASIELEAMPRRLREGGKPT